MTYRVHWGLVDRAGHCLERDAFANAFASYEEALSFVFDKLSAFPSFGFNERRRFWWTRGGSVSRFETRFRIVKNSRPVIRAAGFASVHR